MAKVGAMCTRVDVLSIHGLLHILSAMHTSIMTNTALFYQELYERYPGGLHCTHSVGA